MNKSAVTYVKIFLIDNSDTDLKGFAEIKLYDSVVLAGIKVIEDKNGDIKIHYPKNPKSKRGMYYHFITDQTLRNEVDEQVKTEYENLFK